MIIIYFSIIFLSVAVCCISYFVFSIRKEDKEIRELNNKILKCKLDMYQVHLDYLERISNSLDELKDNIK